MPVQETKGSVSAQGYGFGLGSLPIYIEDVFSTYLYTGNGSTQTITNNIDLSGKGGLVWFKSRSSALSNSLFDTARGTGVSLLSNSTLEQQSDPTGLTAFSSSGFTVGSTDRSNGSGLNIASWTFRKQPKFFDIVTGTADSSGNVSFNHSLGSVPGCVIIKSTTNASDWWVYHRSLGNNAGIRLNLTNAQSSITNLFSATSTTFTANIGYGAGAVGYVAYLFAHDAGGFGASGTDNVISCGSFTGPNQTVTLGYEPQWIMYKDTVAAGTSWQIIDNMRGMSLTDSARLFPNSSGAEVTGSQWITPTATGFITGASFAANTFIYIAIRRGPMKTPTTGTSVFAPTTTATATSPGATATTGFPVDLSIYGLRNLTIAKIFFDRLRGTTSTSSNRLESTNTNAEASSVSNGIGIQSNTTVTENWTGATGYNNILWNFQRAPGFFDVVCYTGTGVVRTVNHNLGVAPELMIVKSRSRPGEDWPVYSVSLGTTIGTRNLAYLNQSSAATTNLDGPACFGNSTTITPPTNSVFTVGTQSLTNSNADTYVAYLFATCAGVSKVGSYTGTGALQTINCGFTSGARFVLIKRTDSTGDWWVYDSARGISSGNDPYLFLNSTAAEVTGTNYVDTTSVGFQVTAAAPAGLNANGGTYIFLAVA